MLAGGFINPPANFETELFTVARVLYQPRVCYQISGRQRKQYPEGLYVAAGFQVAGATVAFEGPVVARHILVEANQVGTTMSFPVQLTTALINDVAQL